MEIGENSVLKIEWNYKDLVDYYPVPMESSGEYVIVRENTPRAYRFLVTTKEKAGEIVRSLLAGEQDLESIQQQVGLSTNAIENISRSKI